MPENSGNGFPPQPGATPPPYQPVAPPYQPVGGTAYQPTGMPGQGMAPPPTGGNSTLKVVMIIVAVLLVLGVMVLGVIGYGVWRVSRGFHKNADNGVSINMPGGVISTNPTQKFTADELGTVIYPGAETGRGGVKMTLPTGPMVTATYLTTDSKDKVIAFYKDKLGSKVQVMESDSGAVMTLNKGGSDTVMVTVTQKTNRYDGKTQIHIIHTSKSQ
jgi:hypothetical protein